MKTIENATKLGLTITFFTAILSAGNVSAQILHVDSVSVDSVWNSDSSWYDINSILQQRVSRDCNVSFIPQGEGTAQMFIAISMDSGKTWAPKPDSLIDSLIVQNYALYKTFVTGQKATITVRVLGGNRPGVAFKMIARQAAPIIVGNPKTNFLGIVTPPTPGQKIGTALSVSLVSVLWSINGYCPLAKVYWDALGDGTIDDSTTGTNALTWTWLTQVPAGASRQRRAVIARAIDKIGLSSVPETLTVQFGLQRIIAMKDIPTGTFIMGSDSSVDYGASPPHQVTLSAFKMQETDVTQEQYLAVMGTNPSYFDSGTGAALRPVETVSWYDAVHYCNALSKLSGLDTVYNTTTWAADFTKSGYRLPTEAQWEYACRAGSITEFWWGPDTNGMGARTWSYNNSGGTTQPVATKLANAYGLYDMTGNVWQWCNDWYGSYTAGAATDPTGATTGTYRVLRGGSWNYYDVDDIRSANRYYNDPDVSNYVVIGFRVVLPR